MAVEFMTASPSPAPPESVSAEAPRPEPAHQGFAQVLARIGGEIDRGERMLQGVVTGRAGQLGPGDLIALQANIYRYTEVVDLTSKFVDRAAGAVRTTLQSGT